MILFVNNQMYNNMKNKFLNDYWSHSKQKVSLMVLKIK